MYHTFDMACDKLMIILQIRMNNKCFNVLVKRVQMRWKEKRQTIMIKERDMAKILAEKVKKIKSKEDNQRLRPTAEKNQQQKNLTRTRQDNITPDCQIGAYRRWRHACCMRYIWRTFRFRSCWRSWSILLVVNICDILFSMESSYSIKFILFIFTLASSNSKCE